MKLPFPGGNLCVLAAGSRENARRDAQSLDPFDGLREP